MGLIKGYWVKDEEGQEFIVSGDEHTNFLQKDKEKKKISKEGEEGSERKGDGANLRYMVAGASPQERLSDDDDGRKHVANKLYYRCEHLQDLAFDGLIAKPKFWRKCPTCGNRLTKQFLRLFVNYNYYTCDCGYEYARESSYADYA